MDFRISIFSFFMIIRTRQILPVLNQESLIPLYKYFFYLLLEVFVGRVVRFFLLEEMERWMDEWTGKCEYKRKDKTKPVLGIIRIFWRYSRFLYMRYCLFEVGFFCDGV